MWKRWKGMKRFGRFSSVCLESGRRLLSSSYFRLFSCYFTEFHCESALYVLTFQLPDWPNTLETSLSGCRILCSLCSLPDCSCWSHRLVCFVFLVHLVLFTLFELQNFLRVNIALEVALFSVRVVKVYFWVPTSCLRPPKHCSGSVKINIQVFMCLLWDRLRKWWEEVCVCTP